MLDRLALHAALGRLDPRRLTAGRVLRGLTKKALAERLGKTPSAVTQFESGRSGLDVETFAALVVALGLPPGYFARREQDLEVDFSACHFRANKDVPQAERRKALRHAMTVVEAYRALERRGVVFPAARVQAASWEGYDPVGIEALAQEARRAWSLGNGPILSMAALLEANGVFVVLLPPEAAKLHAFSFWAEDRPVVALTGTVSASHMQFDLGHELGHLVLHAEESPGEAECERAANHFAGAFLAPAQAFAADCPRRWDYEAFVALKARWRMSMQAALYRGRQLGLVRESTFRWAMVDLANRGERLSEPGEFDKPLPSLLAKALDLAKAEISLDDLADDLGLAPHETEDLLRSQGVPFELVQSIKRPKETVLEPRVVVLKKY